MHLDLNFHPFKIMVSQELSLADYANRQNLCEQMLAQITPGAASSVATMPIFTSVRL
jgi:hypothetical protein